MSIKALNWTFSQNITPAAKKLVMVALADCADNFGVCFPSIDAISDKSSIDRSTVIRHLKALEEEGLITVHARARGNGSQSSNLYKINFGEALPMDHPCYMDVPPDNSVKGVGSQSTTPVGSQSATGGGRNLPPPIITNHHLEPKKEKNARDRAGFLREIDEVGIADGFADIKTQFPDLTNDLILLCAGECWDYWDGYSKFPEGSTVAAFRGYLRRWIPNCKLDKKIMSHGQGDSPELKQSGNEILWTARVKGFVEKNIWIPNWGNRPPFNHEIPKSVLDKFNIKQNNNERNYQNA